MSASPLSPLPTTTPLRSDGSPLPGGSIWGADPFPSVAALNPVEKAALPGWPEPGFAKSISPDRPKLGPLPTPARFPTSAAVPPVAVFEPVPPDQPPVPPVDPIDPPATAWIPAPELPDTGETLRTSPFVPVHHPAPPAEEKDFTDDDLREALAPLLKDFSYGGSADGNLEPMLRATIRRALAECSPTGRPFQNPTPFDRLKWRMQALFSSRTYEDIFFEKTHRFQVEEVYLVDAGTLALVSYASANPGRHASTRRVESTIKRIAHQIRNADGSLNESFKLPDNRNVVSQRGSFITLLAIVRGQPNEMAVNDLSYALDNIEARFCERFRDHSTPLLKVLQPFLEDCLLIQSPATAV